MTEDFVRHYDVLVSRTRHNPSNIRAALNCDGQLAVSIRELDDMWRVIEQHRRFSKRRFIVQAHPKFRLILDDYEKRWKNHTVMALWDWEAEQRGEEPLSRSIDRMLEEMAEASRDNVGESVDGSQHEVHEWEFDPDEHSAASLIEFVENILRLEIDSGGEEHYAATCSRSAGALKWIRESVGLDITQIQRRWNEFPVITVPKHVSDRHGIKNPRSLFAYLDEIRLAYIIGADLSAIAMCRAVTEILIRVHYNQDDKTNKPKLTPLIVSTQRRGEFSFLRRYNLVAKVEESNDILHFNKQDDINHRDRSGALIREWVALLQEMILRSPTLRNGF